MIGNGIWKLTLGSPLLLVSAYHENFSSYGDLSECRSYMRTAFAILEVSFED